MTNTKEWEKFEATNPRATLLEGHLYFHEEDIKDFLSRRDAEVVGEISDRILVLNDSYQDFVDVCERISGDPSRTGVEASIALEKVKEKQNYLLSLLPTPQEENK